jgi:predicted dithiol-disulfide oxidoreductase (DUF899 family)
VFHSYSTYARGIDTLNTAYHYLDLVPKGRDEAGLEFSQAWVRYHDEYDAGTEDLIRSDLFGFVNSAIVD